MNPQWRLDTEGSCCLWMGLAQQEIGGLGGVKGAQAQLLNSHLGPLCQLLPLVSCLALDPAKSGVHLHPVSQPCPRPGVHLRDPP